MKLHALKDLILGA